VVSGILHHGAPSGSKGNQDDPHVGERALVEFGCNRLRALVVLLDTIELIFTIAEADGVVEHLGV